MNNVRIYLDYNATRPLYPDVVETMTRLLRDEFGNASSVHAFGQRAKTVLDDARGEVAALIDADPGEVVFTSGGTEADNFALRGAAEGAGAHGPPASDRQRHRARGGPEHAQGARAARLDGRSVVRWRDRRPVAPALRDALTPDTALVSVMHANNEVGTIQPIAELAARSRERGALFHTDAVQSVGKIPVSVRALGVDLLSLSGHKFGGPEGHRRALDPPRRPADAVHDGRPPGAQPPRRHGERPGAGRHGRRRHHRARDAGDRRRPRIAALRDRLERGILAAVPGTAVNGDPARRVPNTTNISFDGVEAESLLIALDLEGVAVSTGSACSSGSLEPSHVLRAMGLPHARTRNSLRFSLGPEPRPARSISCSESSRRWWTSFAA